MTEPRKPALSVGTVTGRYPSRPRALKSENVGAVVVEREPGVFVIRLDDRGHDEFWMQLVVTVDKAGGWCS